MSPAPTLTAVHSDVTGVAQDFAVASLGALTSFITAAVLAAVEIKWGYSLYSYTFWFVIPVGAIGFGFVAASGYYFGARLFNHRPTRLLLVNIVVISVFTFFLIYYLNYYFITVDGKAVRDYVPFLDFLSIVLSHESLQFSYRLHPIGSAVEMGSWGYLYAALQVVGFAIGGFTVFGYLKSMPYCERCSKYLVRKEAQTRYTTHADSLADVANQMRQCVIDGHVQKAIDLHAVSGDENARKEHLLRSQVEIKRCKDCEQHWMRFSISRSVKGEWKDVSEVAFQSFTDEPIGVRSLSRAADARN